MAIPKITDLVLYVNKAIRGVDWNSNWQKIINWLSGGETDINVNSVTTNSISNSGTINANGLDVNGNADISGNLVVGGVISGDGSGLTGVQSTSTIAYTPFTVNSGYVDRIESSVTYGKEVLMEKKTGYNNLVEFKVPILATTSDGVTFPLEELDDLDVSNFGDGTYTVCIKKNQQRVELKMGSVYRQRLAPTDVSIPNNSLWLDTSTENIQCYEKLNNTWTEKYDGVPIGEVVVASGEVDSVKTYHYNWNGYDINVQEKIDIEQRPVIMIKTWYASNINWNSKQEQTDSYEVYSNDLVVQCGRIKWNDGENGQSHTVPLEVSLSKVCSVNVTPFTYGGNTSEGRVISISGGTVVITGGTTGNHEGVLLWEVKGYK